MNDCDICVFQKIKHAEASNKSYPYQYCTKYHAVIRSCDKGCGTPATIEFNGRYLR